MLDMHRHGLLSRRHCPTRPWIFRCSFMQLPASITASSAGLVICAAMRATRTLSVAHVAAIAEGKGQVCALIAIQDPASPAPHSSVVCSALPAENPTPFHPSHVLPKTAQSANKQKKKQQKEQATLHYTVTHEGAQSLHASAGEATFMLSHFGRT